MNNALKESFKKTLQSKKESPRFSNYMDSVSQRKKPGRQTYSGTSVEPKISSDKPKVSFKLTDAEIAARDKAKSEEIKRPAGKSFFDKYMSNRGDGMLAAIPRQEKEEGPAYRYRQESYADGRQPAANSSGLIKELERRGTSYRPIERDETGKPIETTPNNSTQTGSTGSYTNNYQGSTESTGSTGSTANSTGSSRFQGLNDNQNLQNAMKEIIQYKQGYNRNLQKQKTALTSLQSMTAPAGSAGSKRAFDEAGMGGFEFGEDFRSMSPQDQASMIQARDNAINAHIKGLDSEAEYRGTRLSDTMTALSDMIDAQTDLTRAEADKYKDNLSNFEKKLSLGIPLVDKDWTDVGYKNVVNGRSGGSVAWRNNNPGNVKKSGVTSQYAMKDSSGNPMTDNQGHLIFATREDGEKAMRADLSAKINGGSAHMSENPTLAKLGSVYAEDGSWASSVASMLGVDVNTRMKNIDFEQFVQAVQRQEGWEEGTILANTINKAVKHNYTYTQAQKIAKAAGLNVADMWNTMSDEQIAELELSNTISTDAMQPTIDFVKENMGDLLVMHPSLTEDILAETVLAFNKGATIDQIEKGFAADNLNFKLVEKILKQFGLKSEGFSFINNEQKDETTN